MATVALWVMLASADRLYQHGVGLFEKGDLAGADAPLAEAARLAPHDARIWKALGVVRAAAKNYAAADEPFSNACRLDPRLVDACYYHGRNLYAQNRFEPALEALKKAFPVDARPWRVHLAIAQALEALGSGDAEGSFETAIRLHDAADAPMRSKPDDDPRIHYGVFLFRQGRLAQAEALLQAVAAQRPESMRAQFEYGRVLYQGGSLERAERHLRRAAEGGYGAAAHLLLGKTYQRMGRPRDAQQHLKAGESAAGATSPRH